VARVTLDEAFLAEDAADRRAALAASVELSCRRRDDDDRWLDLADTAYRWLRDRDTLHPVSVAVTPGTPYPEGTGMTATFDLSDTSQVEFSLTGLDAKGASVPLPAGFAATWALADPDASGAVLTPSADGTTAVLAAGVPDVNLLVSVSVAFANPDGSTATLTGAEAVVVTAGPAATVGLVAGTPVPEVPPVPPAV
jgi:hypothetical protein